MPLRGEVGKEGLNLRGAHRPRVPWEVEANKAPNPEEVCLLCL